MSAFISALWMPVNNARLVLFRILFGFVMIIETAGSVINGEVLRKYAGQHYNFPFFGFEWLQILHGSGMRYYFLVMAVAALFVAAGFLYRASGIVLAVMWTAVYLSDKGHYNNHFYLIVLLCWLMVMMPAASRWSFDNYLGIGKPSDTCRGWHIYIFIFQIAVVYFFAAVAKMNADWLHAIPVKQWLFQKTGVAIIGKFLRNPLMPWMIAYGGLFFDLLIVPIMFIKSVRLYAFAVAVCFHLFNHLVFEIGTFPLLATFLFVFFAGDSQLERIVPAAHSADRINTDVKPLVKVAVGIFIMIQLLLPLRHWLIKGNVSWTEEGHRLSWRMMVRSKIGTVTFKIKDKKSDSTWYLPASAFFDSSNINEIAVLPDITLQAAKCVRETYAKQSKDVKVFAIAYSRLNYRPPRLFIDSLTDLSAQKWHIFSHNPWILLYE